MLCFFFILIQFNEQEVLRIKTDHPNDNKCIVNDRVKGRLKVTRAFGAGYLKQVIQGPKQIELLYSPQPLLFP